MRSVKSRDTAPELAVRRAATSLGYRYRLHRASLPGKPDLVFGPRRKVVFVHGCFWHGHDCSRGSREPKSNSDYWRAKITRNRERDANAIAALQKAGWQTLVIWECETRDPARLRDRLIQFLT
ncbi:MAG: very short patch repair endonuclease [Sphingomonas sanxanigenens]|uniref:Very short patch repair endonuclease n=1 Tax=Sphingomonas sanxanigenens TaxID=397260 RepID=A0A2W5A6G8_9SPHN|nr:MAG: very short patch repair endonuclease [Sphingomonas sanxanigenens]